MSYTLSTHSQMLRPLLLYLLQRTVTGYTVYLFLSMLTGPSVWSSWLVEIYQLQTSKLSVHSDGYSIVRFSWLLLVHEFHMVSIQYLRAIDILLQLPHDWRVSDIVVNSLSLYHFFFYLKKIAPWRLHWNKSQWNIDFKTIARLQARPIA